MQQQRLCILQTDQSLIHWALTESSHTDGYLKHAHIFMHMIYPFALQTDIYLHDNSRTYGNPSNETSNLISINKHLLESLTQ
jgi:hypothetical protein